MSQITEHAIQVMNDCREASIIARAETLKEVIAFCDNEVSQYTILLEQYRAKGEIDQLGLAAACILSINNVKKELETKLNALSL